MNRSERVLATKNENAQRAAVRSIDWLGLDNLLLDDRFVREHNEHPNRVQEDISRAPLNIWWCGGRVKCRIDAKLSNHGLNVRLLKVDQLRRMCETVSNVLNQTKVVTMLFRDKSKCVRQIYPRVERRERTCLEQPFDLRIIDHKVTDVCSEIVLSKATTQHNCRAIRFAVICGHQRLIIVEIELVSLHKRT